MKYVIAICLLLGACKQGEGERCQVTEDCKSPLTCNQATQTCQSTGGNPIDVITPVDATSDAPMTDAPMTDAPHD